MYRPLHRIPLFRRRRPLSTLATAGLIVTGVPAGLYLYKLIYLGYIPPGSRHERFTFDKTLSGLDIKEESVWTSDRKQLHGLTVKKQDANDHHHHGPILLYLQGNAGNMNHRLPLFKTILAAVPSLTIVGICYRGFGSSSGSATEKGLRIDARSMFQHVQRNHGGGLDRPIFIYGHSLGGAVAIDLVSQLEKEGKGNLVKGLIVENTYTSILDMVQAMYPRYTPYPLIASYFLWNHWPSLQRIKDIRATPVLFLSSSKDEIVPCEHMQALYNAANPQNRSITHFSRSTHMDMYTIETNRFQHTLAEFIKSCNNG
ncbi:bem46 family protein [Lichtheimia corymbifera JMRC:FSU:9682]|uniref:Bem46 family protein n=1 Tax=Lichtheimia corymbifera JMRC:FSU:9682 TaxID=1263082 RepID=A0A068S759_9FUNG|nr:bem46 family protein [Lichtheimia corymbifera JMRC:FSU:9682]